MNKYSVFLLIYPLTIFAQEPTDTLSKKDYTEEIIRQLFTDGSRCIESEEWALARKHYTEILQLSPANPTALFFRAFADEKMGKYNFARADYEQILSMLPTHFETRLCLLLLNQRSGHFTEAFDQANQLVALYPDSLSAIFARAGVERDLKMFELAEEDYKTIASRDTLNTDYLLALMETRLQLQKYSQAELDLRRLVELGIPVQSLKEYILICRKRKR
jgi:tetratricopeptide (TPR) repeat protein